MLRLGLRVVSLSIIMSIFLVEKVYCTSAESVKLDELRHLMKNYALEDSVGIDAYIVSSNDAHQSEYIRPSDNRIKFISGFSGSAGTVVVTQKEALLWTDGRYFLQASSELAPSRNWTLMKQSTPDVPTLEEWLRKNLTENSVIGADPNLTSHESWRALEKNLASADHKLIAVEENLIDKIWKNKTVESFNEIVPQSIIFTGRIAGDKANTCFSDMRDKKVDLLIVSSLDEVAYFLNLRGSDIPYNPVFFSYLVLHSNEVHAFIHEEKLTSGAIQQMKEEKLNYFLHPYYGLKSYLQNVNTNNSQIKRVWISKSSNHALHLIFSNKSIHDSTTPVATMKTIKNAVEINRIKEAHVKDGVAIVKFFSWLEESLSCGVENITEISAAQRLEDFRNEQENYKGPSFATISAFGEHSAFVHYTPSEDTSTFLNSEKIYLCDTGAQFLEGTTDVTRTLHFGQPTDFEKDCFTRVFKGQSKLSRAKFPSGLQESRLDTLARLYLWEVGLDYLHGTGHGIGAYLNVHEYPPWIAAKIHDGPGLKFGMLTSNEPGYYKEGSFGVRIENIVMAVDADTKYNSSQDFLTFETITVVPIQKKMLDLDLLTDDEVKFLNDYHDKCYKVLSPHLKNSNDLQALNWLRKETEPIYKIKK